MVKANRWANWLDKFMQPHSATVNTYTIKPEAKQARQATHVAQTIKTVYVPRCIVASSQ
jgi:hypothetical protein